MCGCSQAAGRKCHQLGSLQAAERYHYSGGGGLEVQGQDDGGFGVLWKPFPGLDTAFANFALTCEANVTIDQGLSQGFPEFVLFHYIYLFLLSM